MSVRKIKVRSCNKNDCLLLVFRVARMRVYSVVRLCHSSDSLVLRAIVNIGKVMGKNISSKRAGRLVPVFGGIVGATVNYSFARKTSEKMKQAYKNAYFEEYHKDGWFSSSN